VCRDPVLSTMPRRAAERLVPMPRWHSRIRVNRPLPLVARRGSASWRRSPPTMSGCVNAWPHVNPGRTTTRLEARPPPHATRLHIDVHPAPATAPDGADRSSLPSSRLASFDVALPADHWLAWPDREPTTS